MAGIEAVKTDVGTLAEKVLEMLRLIEEGFMQNDREPLGRVMKLEDGVNETEKTLTARILELSKTAKDRDKQELSAWEQAVETLERMGDEAANLTERIEIKVNEGLLFSETGVAQFNETFGAMKQSAELARAFLKKQDPVTREKVIDNGFHVKELVERYRKEHTERLLTGVCTPLAANMFFDMLDFTGNLARHASTIVKLF